jgi:ABC-type cobalamin transport system ATPase subunit
MPGSEIAQFKQLQAMQEQAAQQGLQGFAVVASHRTITARMEQAAPYLVQLLKDGKVEQCNQAIDAMTAALKEEGARSDCHITTIEGNHDA